MKLVCDRLELLEAVNLAASVVPSRSPRPILQSVCIRTRKPAAAPSPEPSSPLGEGEAVLDVLATDLEVGLRYGVEKADVERGGAALLPAAKATAILRELEGDKVELSTEDNVTTIKAGGSRFTIVGEDPREFPTVPPFPATGAGKERGSAVAFRLPRIDLERMIRKTSFAAAIEGTRYALNGVLFHLLKGGDRLRLVATDGKRLARCERGIAARSGAGASPGDGDGATEVKVVVPTKGVDLLQRLAGATRTARAATAATAPAHQDPLPAAERERADDVELLVEEGQILARVDGASMVAQLIQGAFPPYEEVIPQDLDKKVEVDVTAFQAALRRAALLTAKDSLAVRLAFSYNKLTLTARTPQVGESRIELAIPYPFDPIEIAFNPQYIQDALKVLDAERACLELKQETAPAVLREGEDFLYVVMPVNLV